MKLKSQLMVLSISNVECMNNYFDIYEKDGID